ncbi:MAG: MotA/TolQ/ExbB proton channel family protein [Verrucomicrobiae bacterium]|nr:MotA/TolQ/ExbB proton channel family protein [Verrucomicrobiae bacterium]
MKSHPLIRRFLLISILLSFILGSEMVVEKGHAQTAPAAAEGAAPAGGEGAAAEGAHGDKTLLDLFKEGGWIMYPLACMSIWCAALIIECFIRIRLPKFVPANAIKELRQAFGEENYQQAWRICKSNPCFLTGVLIRGLERLGRGRAACESAISEHSLKESMMFRTRVSYLSTIGVVSPMVGLLGTVTGMIKAFQTLGAGGIADPSRLAAAIGEVLIATATGLFMAIPAFFLYYYFRNRLQSVIVLAEDIINQLVADVNFDELQGIKIGEGVGTDSGAIAAAPATAEQQASRVSQAISGVTVNCPSCNAPIAAGSPKCGSCGTELQWN